MLSWVAKLSKTCSNCKTENLDSSEFCEECGKKLPIVVDPRKQSPKKDRRKKDRDNQTFWS